ncbi:MAG TPA: hypothetical protein VKA21_08810 [Candidatus Binatia bacterium]|nr:hypothetical protein [Candidatus Binatia bacterium]
MTTIPLLEGGWLVVALVAWVGVLWLVSRLLFRSHARVRCPLGRRMARVVFVRGPDGAREDVERCTLLESGKVTHCEKQCLATS